MASDLGSARGRVFVFLPNLPPDPGAGALRGKMIVQGLVASGDRQARIVVITGKGTFDPIDGADVVSVSVAAPENTSGLLSRLTRECLLGMFVTLSMLRRSTRQDLIVVSSPPFIPSLMLGFAGALFRRRYVLDVRDAYPLVYVEAGLISPWSLAYRLLSSLEEVWRRKATLIFAATQGLARQMQAGDAEAKIVVAYNGFPERLLQLAPLKRERFTACFHGILGQFQDVDTLVEVARQLAMQDIDVVVIGYGPKADLLKAAELNNLTYLGKLPFEQTVGLVATCHVGLSLRRDGDISKDAFPVKVWECVGLGLPVVATPCSEAGDFLERNRCGAQYASGDVSSIIRWIVRLRDDRDVYAEHVANCREVARYATREWAGSVMGQHILHLMDDKEASAVT